MAKNCEVCRNFMAERAPSEQALGEVPFGTRVVMLCRGHALIAKNNGARTFKALRELYGSGRRSFIARRRDEGAGTAFEQRTSRGRRASDGVAAAAQPA